MNVRKSDNSLEEFDIEKVRASICKAYEGIGEECDDLLLDSVANNLYLYDGVNTSEIRRQVEDALMSINKKVAKEYVNKYNDTVPRKKRTAVRLISNPPWPHGLCFWRSGCPVFPKPARRERMNMRRLKYRV